MSEAASTSEKTEASLVEIEETTLGIFIRYTDARDSVDDLARSMRRFLPPYDRIARAIVVQIRRGLEVTAAGVALSLAGDPGLEEIGGVEFLRNLAYAAPALLDAEDIAKRIARLLRTHREARLQLNATVHSPYPEPLIAPELAKGTFAPPNYLWDDFILENLVNLLYGPGGSAKTTLCQHVGVAVAGGLELFGRKTLQRPVLLVLAEDDYGVTKERLLDICAAFGVELGSLPLVTWCLPGMDLNVAHVEDDGTWQPGAFLQPLRAQIESLGACLVVLDTVSDFATLDENARQPVNTLCKQILGGLCRDLEATLLVTAHPSKAAARDGTGYAGSTAWNNAVRNRLELDWPDDEKGEARVLKVGKSNYGPEVSVQIYLRGHVFLTSALAGRTKADEQHEVLGATLAMLDAGVQIVRGNGSGQKPEDVAASVLKRCGVALTKSAVLRHLNDLERAGQLAYVASDKNSHQRAGFRRGPKCPP